MQTTSSILNATSVYPLPLPTTNTYVLSPPLVAILFPIYQFPAPHASILM